VKITKGKRLATLEFQLEAANMEASLALARAAKLRTRIASITARQDAAADWTASDGTIPTTRCAKCGRPTPILINDLGFDCCDPDDPPRAVPALERLPSPTRKPNTGAGV
jgi:hypothetical protein